MNTIGCPECGATFEFDFETLSSDLARYIFERGDGPNDKAQRIQFKGGEYTIDNSKETDLVGLCESALAFEIYKFLTKED